MPTIDLAVITGLPEEFKVVRDFFPPMEEISEASGIWYRTRVRADTGVNYEVVGGFQDQMGPLGAQALTVRLIDRWDPAYIVLVGIAGSFSTDVRLGDVVVSQQVFHYDPGKATETGIRYRPQGYPSSVSLTRQIEALRLDVTRFGAWQQEAARHAIELAGESVTPAPPGERVPAPTALGAHKPQLHFGTIASGSLVITDPQKRQELLQLHGKILATEMEGAGVMHAAFFHREQPTAAIVVKGISDHADAAKTNLDTEGSWRRLASANPVRLLLALMRRGKIRSLRADEFSVSVTAASPTRARDFIPRATAPGIAMLAFDELVVPYGPLTRLSITVAAESVRGPNAVLEGVVTCVSADGTAITDRLTGAAWVTERPLAPHPVGLYLMLADTPTSVSLTVRTSSEPVTRIWSLSRSSSP